VDSNWPLELSFKINNKLIFKTSISRKEQSELDVEKAIFLLKTKNANVMEILKNRDLNDFSKSLYIRQNLNASLNFVEKKSKINDS
jgi:hypothetical protein